LPVKIQELLVEDHITSSFAAVFKKQRGVYS